MSKEMGRYDTETQMFVEPVHEVNMDVANSIKWGVENGKYEEDLHADVIKLDEVRKELAAIKPTPQEHVAQNGDY
jgi:hypothetical protein